MGAAQVRTIERVGNLVLLRTDPGQAQGVAVLMDRASVPEVAGTIAGATWGMASKATVVPVRVLDCAGSGTWSGVIAGLDYVAGDSTRRPAVANVSLGGSANQSLDDALSKVGLGAPLPVLQILLPIGISFFTFQAISYVVDVYRNEQEPVRNFLDYALFVAFFPQLVAGPIVRAKEFFVDLFHWRRPTHEEWLSGVALIALGAAKKMVLADQMSRVADAYFGHLPDHPGLVAAWSGVFAFAMQIFFDFSGYTDMAIGMALLLGFHFPVNFRRPYLAFSITDFWHRWHMSLSKWLRDYLYIPLGGNRGGTLGTYRNLMLTMLLGGLWHGANWTFIVWGALQGAAVAVVEHRIGLGAVGDDDERYPDHSIGELMVVEADESDRSFLKLFPMVAVITNIDYEHLENYQGFDDLRQALRTGQDTRGDRRIAAAPGDLAPPRYRAARYCRPSSRVTSRRVALMQAPALVDSCIVTACWPERAATTPTGRAD